MQSYASKKDFFIYFYLARKKKRSRPTDGRMLIKGRLKKCESPHPVPRGKLPLNEILRCRVRYFTDGVILGSRVFVEDQYRKRRGLFSEKRETGARPMKGAEYGGLCTVRQLRVDVYGHGAPASG